MRRILVVDGDTENRARIARAIRTDGCEATEVSDFETAIALCRQASYDLMIFDVTFPGVDGFAVLRTIRTFSRIPILVLSAMCSEDDRIRGLEAGADDYMAKPYAPKELMLRVSAILRRVSTVEQTSSKELVSDRIRIDLTARRVHVDERVISLTPKEFDLLTLLVGHPNVAFSRKQILDMIWGGELSGGGTRTLDTHIKQIRHAISPYSKRIITLRGVGYRFE